MVAFRRHLYYPVKGVLDEVETRAMRSLHFLAMCKEIRDLWRENKRTAVIALYEFDHDLGGLLG